MQRIREELLEVVVDDVSASLRRSSTLSVVPSDLKISNIGARVAGGGPCKRDGAPVATVFLNLRSACSRRITCRVLYSAMDNLFHFKGSFSRRRSTLSLRTSINAEWCCSRHVFLRFAVLHAMAHSAMAVVGVPSAGTGLYDTASVLGKTIGHSIWFSGHPGIPSSCYNFLMKPSSSQPPSNRHRRHHRC